MSAASELLRADLRVLAELVPQDSRVLDVGCGDGSLLEHLRDRRGCDVIGIEISPAGVTECVKRHVPVIQANLEEGLEDFPDRAFDVVVVSQTLQEVRNIPLLVQEVMRVGQKAVISYPNFAHVGARVRLAFRGRMPISKALPHQWYDTPNVHFTTVKDFQALCRREGLLIEREMWFALLDDGVRRIRWLPNLRAELAVSVVSHAATAAPTTE